MLVRLRGETGDVGRQNKPRNISEPVAGHFVERFGRKYIKSGACLAAGDLPSGEFLSGPFSVGQLPRRSWGRSGPRTVRPETSPRMNPLSR